MGHRVYNGQSHFFIAKESLPEVLAVLRVLPEWEDTDTSELGQIFHRFGLDITEDEHGNVIDLFLASDHLGDVQEAVMKAIAPFVRDGSYVMFVDEHVAQWAWVFRTNPETGAVEAHEEDVIPLLVSEYERLRTAGGKASP